MLMFEHMNPMQNSILHSSHVLKHQILLYLIPLLDISRFRKIVKSSKHVSFAMRGSQLSTLAEKLVEQAQNVQIDIMSFVAFSLKSASYNYFLCVSYSSLLSHYF